MAAGAQWLIQDGQVVRFREYVDPDATLRGA